MTLILFSFDTRRRWLIALPISLRRLSLNLAHMRNLFRGTTSRSAPLQQSSSRRCSKSLRFSSLLSSRNEHFGKRQQFSMPNIHRPAERPFLGRYSRHYYDLAMLAQSDIKPMALADLDLLATVVRHKQTFYPSAWARYDLAAPGSLRLAPRAERIPALRLDYRDMAAMIFGEVPPFDSLIRHLALLESEINQNAPHI